ncbi:MAG: biotin/lipoyl-binding protein [SAR202 cluster bacterium]|nr:biotin/lipoyl-binding protein [SAR202 cluster bacterium]
MRRMRVRVNGEWYNIEVGDVYQSPVEVVVDGESYLVELDSPVGPARVSSGTPAKQERKQEVAGLRGIMQGNDKTIRCPLPGRVVNVTVTKGQVINPGDELCTLESMKMEQSVRSAHSGVVKNVKIKKDQSVNAGTPLIELQ